MKSPSKHSLCSLSADSEWDHTCVSLCWNCQIKNVSPSLPPDRLGTCSCQHSDGRQTGRVAHFFPARMERGTHTSWQGAVGQPASAKS